MKEYNTKIYYLYNSGFVIETVNNMCIFDYYYDKPDNAVQTSSKGIVDSYLLKTVKDLTVFASHSHGDHYNPSIFKLQNINPNINYVLSSDIKPPSGEDRVYSMTAYEEKIINGLAIKTFGSTDMGVSFLLNIDGINIFHAGDLNWWHWYDEPDSYNKAMEKAFKEEIEKIKGNKIDIAFFPVDSRLKEYYNIGAEYFIKELKPDILIPMHFREDFAVTKMFKEKMKSHNTRIIEITHRGQEISL